MLLTASGGIITEIIAFRLLYQRQKEDLNIRGAFWHVMQTFVGSLIIIISALVIRFTGFLEIDPLLGMAFGVVLFVASWKIIRSSLRMLFQATPEGLDLEAVIADLRRIEGVRDLHHVHAWSITSGRDVFSGHIRVNDFAADGVQVLREASHLLSERFKFYFSTLQIEDERLAHELESAEIDITEAHRHSEIQ
jgi:cobalt-zinc-cadmium efflux system protein